MTPPLLPISHSACQPASRDQSPSPASQPQQTAWQRAIINTCCERCPSSSGLNITYVQWVSTAASPGVRSIWDSSLIPEWAMEGSDGYRNETVRSQQPSWQSWLQSSLWEDADNWTVLLSGLWRITWCWWGVTDKNQHCIMAAKGKKGILERKILLLKGGCECLTCAHLIFSTCPESTLLI